MIFIASVGKVLARDHGVFLWFSPKFRKGIGTSTIHTRTWVAWFKRLVIIIIRANNLIKTLSRCPKRNSIDTAIKLVLSVLRFSTLRILFQDFTTWTYRHQVFFRDISIIFTLIKHAGYNIFRRSWSGYLLSVLFDKNIFGSRLSIEFTISFH